MLLNNSSLSISPLPETQYVVSVALFNILDEHQVMIEEKLHVSNYRHKLTNK